MGGSVHQTSRSGLRMGQDVVSWSPFTIKTSLASAFLFSAVFFSLHHSDLYRITKKRQNRNRFHQNYVGVHPNYNYHRNPDRSVALSEWWRDLSGGIPRIRAATFQERTNLWPARSPTLQSAHASELRASTVQNT